MTYSIIGGVFGAVTLLLISLLTVFRNFGEHTRVAKIVASTTVSVSMIFYVCMGAAIGGILHEAKLEKHACAEANGKFLPKLTNANVIQCYDPDKYEDAKQRIQEIHEEILLLKDDK